MLIFSELKKLVGELESYSHQWAVCGGIAASIYRSSPRFTNDIDIAVRDSVEISARDMVTQVILKLGYREYAELIKDPLCPDRQLDALICARTEDAERFQGIDFLLPVQTWVTRAVEFAQNNLIDFGFAKLPTVTPESLIVSKLIALNSNPERYQDMDDIKNILKHCKTDLDFIRNELARTTVELSLDLARLIGNCSHG